MSGHNSTSPNDIDNDFQFPNLPDRAEIQRRLIQIFLPGTPNRNYCIRELSASTVYVMLYIDAIEGTGIYLAPKHVYRMTIEQSLLTDAKSRKEYREKILLKNYQVLGTRWYADNTREPIRDETLREGLVYIGAVTVKKDLATTSSRPRYALQKSFSALFDSNIGEQHLVDLIKHWQRTCQNAAHRQCGHR